MNPAAQLQHATRHWPILVALALYLVLALPDLYTPGLHYDEALEAAMPAALLLQGQSFPIVNDGALQIGMLRLPLMVQNHIGAIQVYFAMPFVALLGPTTVALRTMTVIVGAATLIGLYAFMLRAYGRTAAGAAALALAAFPSFVLWSRQGVFVTNLAPCLAAWAFAVAARRQSGTAKRSAFVGLLAGLAVWAKLSALWLVVGTIAWAVVVWLSNRRRRLPFIRPASLIPFGFGFVLGTGPLILYNLLTGFQTFVAVGESAETTYLGTSNLDVFGNFHTRLVQFADVVVSGQHLWYLGGQFPNGAALLCLLAALITICVLLVGQRWHGWRQVLFLPFLTLACIVQSCFTISALWYTHFAIAVWLPAAVVGVAAGMVERWGVEALERRTQSLERRERQKQAIVSGGIIAFLLIGVVPQAGSTLSYLEAAKKTGGLSFHSSAIEDVSRFLATRPEAVVALDWGLSAQVEYLTNGRKRVEELYGFTRDVPADFAAMVQQRFGRSELYLTHSSTEEAFPRRQAFLDAVAAAGLRAETVNVSTRKDGLPVIEVWRIVK